MDVQGDADFIGGVLSTHIAAMRSGGPLQRARSGLPDSDPSARDADLVAAVPQRRWALIDPGSEAACVVVRRRRWLAGMQGHSHVNQFTRACPYDVRPCAGLRCGSVLATAAEPTGSGRNRQPGRVSDEQSSGQRNVDGPSSPGRCPPCGPVPRSTVDRGT